MPAAAAAAAAAVPGKCVQGACAAVGAGLSELRVQACLLPAVGCVRVAADDETVDGGDVGDVDDRAVCDGNEDDGDDDNGSNESSGGNDGNASERAGAPE